MTSSNDAEANSPPGWEPTTESVHTLEVVAQLTGVSEETILTYQENGLLGATSSFDDDALLNLSRIEHLRAAYQANLQGVKWMLDLLAEIEHLQQQLRARR